MRVLIACEYSGRVRDAFIKLGHDAMSCDLLPTELPGPHYQGDVRDVVDAVRQSHGQGWDLIIAHPPCTFMANSGAKHLYAGMKKENGRNEPRWAEMHKAAEFFLLLWNLPIPKKAIENPIMLGHAKSLIGVKQTCVIQPHQFGHGETKATCLWLQNLPLLIPTNQVEGREGKCHAMPPSPDRWKNRSRTYQGIADAMAAQWGEKK